MMLPSFTPGQWVVVALSALCVGVNKSGLPGLSLLYVATFAWLFPGQASTGVVLPISGPFCFTAGRPIGGPFDAPYRWRWGAWSWAGGS